MLGGLFAFAFAIGPKIEKKLLQDCPRRDHTTVQRGALVEVARSSIAKFPCYPAEKH
jgi:hypothetical protein